MVYQNQLGEFDFKTKELDNLLRSMSEAQQMWLYSKWLSYTNFKNVLKIIHKYVYNFII